MIVCKNLICLEIIEKIEPGISKFLHQNFGIHNFGRFSIDFWIDQYRNREKTGEYGLIITSMEDWNSSSYHDEAFQTYIDLYKNVRSSHFLRAVEVEELPTLVKLLSKTRKKVGQPDFVIWSGHGNDKELIFGKNMYRPKNYKYTLNATDFSGQRIIPYLNLFSKDTLMIMDACSKVTENNLPPACGKQYWQHYNISRRSNVSKRFWSSQR